MTEKVDKQEGKSQGGEVGSWNVSEHIHGGLRDLEKKGGTLPTVRQKKKKEKKGNLAE